MAQSSYQTLARYEDCSPHIRTRCMSDIRQRQREELSTSRSETRQMLHLKLRRLSIFSSDYEEDSSCEYESNYNSSDDYQTLPICDSTTATGWPSEEWVCQAPPSSTPSPSLSSGSSDYGSSSIRSCNSPLRLPNRPKTRKEMLNYRKRVHSANYNPETIKEEFQNLNAFIRCNANNSEFLRFNVCSRWKALADAIDSSDEYLAKEAMDLLICLLQSQAIKVSDLLFIFQQGLYMSLKNALMRLGRQQVVAASVFICIVRTDPQATPYIVELMSNTHIFNILDDLLCMGTEEEAHLVTELYYSLFEILIHLNSKPDFEPTLPDTMLQSSCRVRISEIYQPSRSLKRLIRPQLINTLTNRFFNHLGQVDEYHLKLAMSILANCVSFTYAVMHTPESEADWAIPVINAFSSTHLGLLITRACDGDAITNYKTIGLTELKNFLNSFCLMTTVITKLAQ